MGGKKKAEGSKGKRYFSLPSPPTPHSTPVASPASSFKKERTTSGRSINYKLPVIDESLYSQQGRANSDGAVAKSRRPVDGTGGETSGKGESVVPSPSPSEQAPPERTFSQVAKLRRQVKRSYTEGDASTSVPLDVAITINDNSRTRTGARSNNSDFLNFVAEYDSECTTDTGIRRRATTLPERLLKTGSNLPRVLSAVKELDKSLAEEKLDEIAEVSNLNELDLQIIHEVRTPKIKTSKKTKTKKGKSKDNPGLHTVKSKNIEVTSPTSSDATQFDISDYGDSVESMQEDDLFISTDLPMERVAPLCQKCAAICAKNVMHQKEYTLRCATEWKLTTYKIVTSRGYHLLMLSVSIFHVILASFEPSSVDMLSSDSHYIDMAKDQVQIAEAVIIITYVFDICIGRILSTNRIFWLQKLNLARIVCTAIMGVDLILTLAKGGTPRFSRFLRPMQCILLSANLYGKLISVIQAGLAARKALSLLLLTIFLFSIAGMELFANSKDWIQFVEEQTTCGFDFRDIYHSFVSLYVLLTTENYSCVMMPAIRGKIQLDKERHYVATSNMSFDTSAYNVVSLNGENVTELTSDLYDKLKSHGQVEMSRTLHVLFFVIFLLVTTFGVLNVLIASVYNTYRQHAIQTSYIKRRKERKSLLIAYELLTMNKMMTRESIFGSPFRKKEDAYLDYLTFRDLVRMTMGSNMDEEKLVFYWNKIDTDKSGYVDPLEFLSLVDVLGLTLFRVCETNLSKLSVKSIWRTQLKRLVTHPFFNKFLFALLIGNALLLCTKGLVNNDEYGTILIVNDILSLFYFVEMVTKIAALGREYWAGIWNQYDCLTTIVGILALISRLKPVRDIIHSNFVGSIGIFIGILSKVMRILRIMTIGKKESNQFLLLLFRIIPTSLTFLVLTFLVCCVYAYIGLEVFPKFNEGNYLKNDYYDFASFSNFSAALMLMFQVLTTSNWHEIMLEANRTLAFDVHPNLAFIITAVYFISFGILSINIVLHLMQAVFVDSWRQIHDMNKKLKKKLIQVRHDALTSQHGDSSNFASQEIKDSILFSEGGERKSRQRTDSNASNVSNNSSRYSE